MGKLFGTDGVRGVANVELTPELAFAIGRAGAATVMKRRGSAAIVIGKDTRVSCDMLEASVAAGIMSAGGRVLQLGVVPTPAVAFLTRDLGADAGIVISASHNPIEYNGIKFFSDEGYKLLDEDEEEIEYLVSGYDGEPSVRQDRLPRPQGAGVGQMESVSGAEDRYVRFAVSHGPDLSRLKIVVDCANGAAYRVAPRILSELGAEVIPINVEPNGLNINVACGSTHPEVASRAVLEHGAHIGLSHDGDADRVIAIDEKGNVVNGDHIMAICGLDMLRKGRLARNSIVATVYSNLGLIKAFQREGGEVICVKAGDRYVLEEMRKQGIILGGEQSGHVIFLEQNTTGDGIITSLNLLRTVIESGKPLSQLARQMPEYPQLLINVRVADKEKYRLSAKVAQAVRDAEERLGREGRIFVRPSGTEPLIRILREGPDPSTIHEVVHGLAGVIREECG